MNGSWPLHTCNDGGHEALTTLHTNMSSGGHKPFMLFIAIYKNVSHVSTIVIDCQLPVDQHLVTTQSK